ncbi:DUF4870 domain-containing protein [Chitinophaga sp. 212800010-3]|uniref:DUF4870 domain-containing protein n=1 Tax=unclassified Chitinophaga TaxID=2619133 RepID=UPI002DEFFA27|nr:DUF4870 domain-containing protein [Chitinophaga sp. 212800010-3]
MNPKDERTWGTLVHLGGLIGMFIIPTVGNILGVLILWLIKRNESSLVDEQGKEAINFQITISIAAVALNVLSAILSGLWSMATFWSRGYFFYHWSWFELGNLVWILNVVFSIIAAVKASNGELYKYPVSLRLVK